MKNSFTRLGAALAGLLLAFGSFAGTAGATFLVPQGGTGVQTATQHGVIIGNGVNPFNVTGAGTSGYVLTSNGASADPTFQAVTSAFSGTLPISVTAGVISITQADTTHNGYLSSTDWNTFNNKGSGTVTSVATNNGLTGGTITTTGTIGLAAIAANSVLANKTGASAVPVAVATSSLFNNASGSNTGLLSSSDWTTFNAKLSAAITSFGAQYSTLDTSAAQTIASSTTGTDFAIRSSGGTTTFYLPTASGSNRGLLSAADWTTFNGKGSGSVTSVGLTDSNSTLTIGSTPVTTSGTITATLNLAHSNLWSVLQSFALASSTQMSVFGKAYFGGTATTTIDSAGNILIPSGSSLTNTGRSDGCATWASGVITSLGSPCGTSSGTVTSIGLTDSNSTLTIGSTPVTTSGTITATLNLGHSNIWTVLQSFSLASTTLFSNFGTAYFGGTATTTIDSAGNTSIAGTLGVTGKTTLGSATTTNISASNELVIPNGSSKGSTVAGQTELDTTNDQLKVGDGSAVSVYDPRRFLTFTYATSTAFTGTTTQLLGFAPSGLTIKSAQCTTDVGTLNVTFKYAASPTSLAMFNASTTAGTVSFASNNTPAAGDPLKVDIGTPATAPTTLSCTFTALMAAT